MPERIDLLTVVRDLIDAVFEAKDLARKADLKADVALVRSDQKNYVSEETFLEQYK